MAKDGRIALLRAGIVLGAFTAAFCLLNAVHGGPPGDRENVAATLEVQKALQVGRELVVKGNYEAAVHILEEKLSRINGSREYLAVLREAYRGRVKELRLSGRDAEADVYNRRLLILDPGAVLETASTRPANAITPSANQTKATEDRPKPRPIIRMQNKEDDAKSPDVFAQANVEQARSLVQDAEKEYLNKHYEAAARLFEQAHRVDSSITAGCGERWGYCKLFTVVERLNHPAGGAVPLGDLEREVRLAMALAPAKLDGCGQDLLKRIHERQGTEDRSAGLQGSLQTVSIRHLERAGNGWAIAETANFRVYHNQPREIAEKAAQVAEQTRTAMLKKWFGATDEPWQQKCDLYLHATAQDYAQATGVPANSPGHSEISSEGSHVFVRRMHMHCDNPNMLSAVLPHETTHVVLAGRFGDKAVPRWADEGMAVLTEPREQIDRHLRNLPKHSQERQLFYLRDLMQLADYPEPRRVGAFYSQSVSVVEFLSRQKGPQVFTQFLRDGMQGNYEEALRRNYGFQDFNEMEQRWRQFAFQSNGSANGVASRNP
jgi:hypothetical protein